MTNLVKLEIEGIGDIIVELDEKAAPLTAANFKTLVSKGFYNGLIFHRVIEGFMIQGGNPTGTGYGGSEVTIKGEFRQNGINNPLSHTRGTISMARSANPDSASSQFFICHADSPFLDGQYAAFGKVIEGMDVVDQIACCETDHRDRPLKEQKIKRAVFVKA
ncbi:MAG: peptidylprolyl isomerase [Clostridiales bacterium]|nr:peptidylprolyl isomerase [Clostridiales bacterium]